MPNADPEPVWQAEEFSFTGESWDGDFYSSGRASGNRPKHADYAWDLGSTGFIHNG